MSLKNRKIVLPISAAANLVIIFIALFTYDKAATLLMPVLWLSGTWFGYSAYIHIKKSSIVDPLAFFWSYGYVFFFVVPLLQSSWNYWPNLPDFADRDEWMATWLCVSIVSLPFFFLGVHAFRFRPRQKYVLDHKRFVIASISLLSICAFAQVVVLSKFGGLDGYIAAYETRIEESIQNYNPYAGLGWLFTVAESAPKLIAIIAIYYLSRRSKGPKIPLTICLVLVVFTSAIVFGGLRGSRGNVVWVMFWFGVMYHMLIRPFSKAEVVCGVVAVLAFMNVYTYFKYGGVEGFQSMLSSTSHAETLIASRRIGDPIKHVIVRDVGRADVQTYALKELMSGDAELAYGRSFLAGIVAFIPNVIYPDKPAPITKEKTEIFWGKGVYSGSQYTTLLVGLGGEFVINFGIVGMPLYFLFFGMVVSYGRAIFRTSTISDPRTFLYPVALILIIQLYIADSNVISQFLVKYMTLPVLLMLFSRKRSKT